MPPRQGLVIFLNGTSSSGKSSIATELLRILDEPYFHMPVDAFHAMRSPVPIEPGRLDTVLHRTWRGYHRAVAGMAAAGNNVVVDHVLSAEWRLRDCLSLFVPEDVVLVGVHCPRRNWSAVSASAPTGRPVSPPANSPRSTRTASTTSSATPAVGGRASVPAVSRTSCRTGRGRRRSSGYGPRHRAHRPPDTRSTAPVVYDASGDISQAIAAATSSA